MTVDIFLQLLQCISFVLRNEHKCTPIGWGMKVGWGWGQGSGDTPTFAIPISKTELMTEKNTGCWGWKSSVNVSTELI